MHDSLRFLAGLLEQDAPSDLGWEDFTGPHGPALTMWQELGFLAREPGANPVPTCPTCDDGVLYRLDNRVLCNSCCSEVDPQELLLWRLDRQAFFCWLARGLQLRGGVQRIDECLWQLGTGSRGGESMECFFRRPGPLSESGRIRLSAFRTVLVLFGLVLPDEPRHGRQLSLLELLSLDGSLAVRELPSLISSPSGTVRFDAESGALLVGDRVLGEVPVGSKEFFFLRCLASHLDTFVSYADLKKYVLRHSGSGDTTEEATFCHRLKNRIKKRGIPKIDGLLATTNKGEGYRMRREVERQCELR